MGVTGGSEARVMLAGPFVTLHGDSAPVIEARLHAMLTGPAHCHDAALPAALCDRRNTAELTQRVGCLREQRRRDPCPNAWQRLEDRDVMLLAGNLPLGAFREGRERVAQSTCRGAA